MVNSNAKGARTVRKGRNELEVQGWLFDTVEKKGKFIKRKDLFGLFDAIAVKGKYHKFIQFKTNLKGKKWMLPFEVYAKTHASKYNSVEIWNWFDHKGFIKVVYNGDKKQTRGYSRRTSKATLRKRKI